MTNSLMIPSYLSSESPLPTSLPPLPPPPQPPPLPPPPPPPPLPPVDDDSTPLFRDNNTNRSTFSKNADQCQEKNVSLQGKDIVLQLRQLRQETEKMQQEMGTYNHNRSFSVSTNAVSPDSLKSSQMKSNHLTDLMAVLSDHSVVEVQSSSTVEDSPLKGPSTWDPVRLMYCQADDTCVDKHLSENHRLHNSSIDYGLEGSRKYNNMSPNFDRYWPDRTLNSDVSNYTPLTPTDYDTLQQNPRPLSFDEFMKRRYENSTCVERYVPERKKRHESPSNDALGQSKEGHSKENNPTGYYAKEVGDCKATLKRQRDKVKDRNEPKQTDKHHRDSYSPASKYRKHSSSRSAGWGHISFEESSDIYQPEMMPGGLLDSDSLGEKAFTLLSIIFLICHIFQFNLILRKG